MPWQVAAVGGIAATAAGLRFWDLGATFASSDQVAMAWMVRHCYGIKWIFAHDYGPVPALVARSWAELLSRLHLPIGEAASRTPVAVASVLQVWVTFALARRMGARRGEAALASAVCATLPALVSDAHYAWGYLTMWLLTASVSLWATLSYLDEDRPGRLLIAGVALLLHCLSNCFAFALPMTLLVVWADRSRSGHANADRPASSTIPILRSFMVGFVGPCVLALGAIGLCWWWTGAGQWGRLLTKQHAGSTGLQPHQLLDLPAIWVSQFGYLFAIPAAIGLIAGTFSPRWRILAVWCSASLLPLVLIVDFHKVGYPAAYMIEAVYAGGLLAALAVARGYQLFQGRPVVRAMIAGASAVALTHLGLGSVDACLGGRSLAGWTGIRVEWGAVRPETAIKAASWYVRRHVPEDAIVMTTHLNAGLEVSVAEYYMGRAVLADCDLKPAMVEPLVRRMLPLIDVLVVETSQGEPVDSLGDLERVATFRCGTQPVRHVYARRDLHLQPMDAQAADLGTRYDREYACRKVPQPLHSASGFDDRLKCYRQIIRSLRSASQPAAP